MAPADLGSRGICVAPPTYSCSLIDSTSGQAGICRPTSCFRLYISAPISPQIPAAC